MGTAVAFTVVFALLVPTLFQVLKLASAQSKRAGKAARDLEKLEREFAGHKDLPDKLAAATGVEPLTFV